MDATEKARMEAEDAAYFREHPDAGTESEEFGPPVIDGELPPFWKPEVLGERRIGEVLNVRKTKDFGEHQGEAIEIRGAEGLSSIPISVGLRGIDWHKQIGMTFMFIFNGWLELEGGTKMRKFIVRPKREDKAPF